MNRKTTLTAIMGISQVFNGLSGMLGGYMLISDPSGNSLNLKMEWLRETPFPNFLIPGIILLLFVGIANVIGFWLTIKKHKKRADYGLFFGIVLMLWIIAQVAWIGYKDFLQPLYFATGLLQAITAFALKDF